MRRALVSFLIFLSISVFSLTQESNSKKEIDVRLQGPPIYEPAKLMALDEVTVKNLLDSKKGKVLLVNLWATWCGPCVREFPELTKLHNVYYDKGVEIILISVDNFNIAETRVKPFLERQKVSFPAYIKNARDDMKFFESAGKGFRNAIPTTFVYDRKGQQVQTLIGARNFQAFEEVVKPLLGLSER